MQYLKIWRTVIVFACLYFCAGCTTPASTSPQALANTPADCTRHSNIYDAYMAEERQWAGLSSKRIKVRGGVDLAYSEGGNLNGPVLILLHGYYGDRNNWNRIAQQLQHQYHLIIPDLPGHGDSGLHPAANYSFPEMTFVLSAFIDALRIEHFHLAGHSMGGAIAIQWTLSRNAQIDSLTLIDSAGKYSHNTSGIAKQMLAGNNPMRIARKGDAAKVMDIAMAMPPFIPSEVMNDFERKQLLRAPVYENVMNDMLARDKSLDIRFFHTALKLFTKPALVIWGEKDAIFSANVAEELATSLPKANLVVLKGVGHTPMLEAPKPTSEAILHFMASSFGQQ